MLTDSNYSKGAQGQDNGLECVSIYNGRQSSCKERHTAPFKNYFLVLQSYVKPFCFLLMIRIMIDQKTNSYQKYMYNSEMEPFVFGLLVGHNYLFLASDELR